MNELLKINKDILAKVEKNGISDIIKPLKKETNLIDTFLDTENLSKKVLKEQKVGDELTLKRDFKNLFDKKAIMVLDKKENLLGYISEVENTILANLMEAGKLIKAKINVINTVDEKYMINVSIYLVDF